MSKLDFFKPGKIEDSRLLYVVIVASYQEKWVFCRHKQRSTWEIPGGHREGGERVEEAALRELREETGAIQARLQPVCEYQVNAEEKCGVLFFAKITEMGELPSAYEMQEILLSDRLPNELTYPDIQPKLFERVQGWLNLQSSADEKWDVYDSARNLTGRLHRRGDMLEKGDYHLVVHVWMQNRNGEFLITRRSPNKGYPNMWETTGGSALAGDDSLTAALREVKEETGLTLNPEQGRVVMTDQRENAFVDLWLFRQDHDLRDVRLQPGETTDAIYASMETIRRMEADGEFVPYSYLDALFAAVLTSSV